MASGQTTQTPQEAAREKEWVAFSSVLAAVFLTALKLITGIVTGSLGILAEAANSGLDVLVTFVTYLAVRLSGKPADRSHPYGHEKVESLSALIETLLLLLTCGWIVNEAVQRLFYKSVHVQPTWWAFAVMGISIVVDITRSRTLSRAAKKHNSHALEADALHFSTDVWSSSIVIIGLLMVQLNAALGGRYPMLERADAIAGLIVATLIVWLSLRLGKKTVDVLLDRAPEGLAQEIEDAARQVEGVLDCYRVRLRQAGDKVFVDLTVAVGRNQPFERSHDIADAVEERIRERVPRADVVVHVEPIEEETENVAERLHVIAQRQGLTVHNVAVYELRRRYYVELHLEVDAKLNLREAHDIASRLERDLRNEIPHIAAINTHIESRLMQVARGQDVTAKSADVVDTVKRVARTIPGLRNCHNVVVRHVNNGLDISLHCTFDGSTPITQIHDASTLIEDRLKAALPQVERVLVHAEPE
ncbi:MAG: cation-efflux pump [Abditibacteriales bacterium]|nr:cation-efflux pump [Abditibacteriales bacterium]MDW8364785.1 cation-efflux pump [Abditibacteriales bacterium]